MILDCLIFENKISVIGWGEINENAKKLIISDIQRRSKTTRMFVQYATLEIYGDVGEILVALSTRHKLFIH